MSRIPTQGIDYTNKDYEAFRNFMLNRLRVEMPEYTDLSQTDAGVQILEANAMSLDILSYYQDTLANEVYLVTGEQRANALKWCSMLSYIPKASTPTKFKQVFVLTTVQPTDIIIPMGTVVKTVGSVVEPSIYFETVEDLVIPAGKLGNEQTVLGVYDYTVDIEQGLTINGELVGSSNGTALQVFTLGYTPAILDSISLLINEGGGFVLWERVDSFIDSTPTSRHYRVNTTDLDEAQIIFGDGISGKIPNVFSNGIFANYRIGGGKQGNVSINTISVLDSSIGLVKETFNPYTAFELGTDKESLEEIKVNAPLSFITKWGALTENDFAEVTKMNFPTVKYSTAKKDPLNQDNITIYVQVVEGEVLDAEFKADIVEMFEERKIAGVDTITISAPTYVNLTLAASVVVKDNYSRASVQTAITTYLNDYFKEGNYDFNTDLSLTDLEALITDTDNAIVGIKSIRFTSPVDMIVTAGTGEIFRLGSLTLNMTGGVA